MFQAFFRFARSAARFSLSPSPAGAFIRGPGAWCPLKITPTGRPDVRASGGEGRESETHQIIARMKKSQDQKASPYAAAVKYRHFSVGFSFWWQFNRYRCNPKPTPSRCLASTVLIGWLYRVVRLAALHQLRIDRRRTQRERLAMEWHQTTPRVEQSPLLTFQWMT